MHNQLKQAIDVVDKLQNWLDGIIEGHEIDCGDLYASFQYAANDTLSITIGEICVFDNQSCSSESLTFEACRDSFLEAIEKYVPFLAVEREVS